MKARDTIQIEKKRQKNPLAFLFRHKPYFLCGGSYKPEVPFSITGIFGAPLECAAQCGTLTPYGLSVPDPVNRCFTEILARGLRVEGLFRLSGAAMEVDQLQQQFDQPPTYGKYLDLTNNDIHAITSVVKKYLRHLPDPVIPIAYHEPFLQLHANWTENDRGLVYEWAKMIKNDFPTTHYHVMHYIILVVSWVQHYQHLNLMNPEALAVVLAPICSGLEKNVNLGKYDNKRQQQQLLGSVDEVMAANSRWTTVWTLLIQHHDILLDHWRPSNTPDIIHSGLWQRHSIPTIMMESDTPWTQSTITVPEEDLLDNSSKTSGDDRYGVIVMRKGYRGRHIPGVAKDDEHIYNDTPLPPLPIPEYHPEQEKKKRHFLLRRPKSIASLQPRIKTSSLF
ncbi:Rho GTPase activation protein [Halteromyces radiatus]|uniref:Rho GTPase activation protein n=1 Tax=Halteromyces radiatus TaxID=101107 RepID=UPI00221F84DE|nr:Rho GTPase activation protein [Halteromyces radiatus]KAI8098818.1 Rho GTPase activation protein [Halteromyces radiatus]